MELICDQCGSIGIYFPRRMAEDEIRRHVEGDRRTERMRKRYPPHPGHVVKVVPDTTRPVI